MRGEMNKFLVVIVSVAVMLLVSVVNTPIAIASGKTANGISVYIGTFPTAMIGGHPKSHPTGTMHGGVPVQPHHHLVVALFDKKTGKRITGARIKAAVIRINSKSTVSYKDMQPMLIGGKITYGNYFRMLPGRYTIRLKIRRVNVPGTIDLEFNYQLAQT